MFGNRSLRRIELENALCTWRARGRSTEPLYDYTESKVAAVRHLLFGIPHEAELSIRVFDSALAWSKGVERAGPRAHAHLKAWAAICHASRVSVAPFLPWLANESESLDDLFRCELGADDPPSTPYAYVPEGWHEPTGKRTPVWLGTYLPRSTDWRSLVAVEWSMRGVGMGQMPEKESALAFETLQALHACAAFVVLDNGVALVCRRPVELHFDAQGRLGRSDGPAVVWADGSTEWFLCDQPVPLPMRERIEKRYYGGSVPDARAGLRSSEDEFKWQGQDGALGRKRPAPEEIQAWLRFELRGEPAVSGWFFEEALHAGRHTVLDTDGLWSQEGQTVMRRTELRQVDMGGETRRYLVEQGDPEDCQARERVIEVPGTAHTVSDALAWTFDPLGDLGDLNERNSN